jgi:hypothetical protein
MSFRPSFKPYVKELFQTDPSQNICHVLSWEYMNNVMTNLVEQLPTDASSLGVWQHSLWCFVNSICLPIDPENFETGTKLLQELSSEHADEDQLIQAKYIIIAEAMRSISQSIVAGLGEHAKIYVQIVESNSEFSSEHIQQLNAVYRDILQLSRELLDWLHSMPTNLKIGNASWNKSIGGAVDPRAWVFIDENLSLSTLFKVDASNHVGVISFGEDKYPVDFTENNKPAGGGVVLTHPVDHIQLTYAFNIDPKFVNPVTYLYTGIYAVQNQDQEQGSVLTVCSSSNPLMLINSNVNHQPIPVYVKNIDDNKWYQRY